MFSEFNMYTYTFLQETSLCTPMLVSTCNTPEIQYTVQIDQCIHTNWFCSFSVSLYIRIYVHAYAVTLLAVENR